MVFLLHDLGKLDWREPGLDLVKIILAEAGKMTSTQLRAEMAEKLPAAVDPPHRPLCGNARVSCRIGSIA